MNDDELVYRLELGLPPQSPEEATAREPYERLIARLHELARFRELECDALPPGWEDDMVDRLCELAARRRK